ncbi:MAG: YnbE family lipoprotein [Minwuia sp.]|nr:YnbE family lipoprotein [Minwuia sp.]
MTRYSGLRARTAIGTMIAVLALLGACTPTVQVAAPKEPITINLNIKLDADVRVRLEEAAKKDIKTNPGIF